MAHRMFQKKIANLLALELAEGPVGTARSVEAHLRHAALVRGITPEEVHSLHNFDLSSTYVVIGPQDDDQGWDADGSPTSEYPGKTLPWPEIFTPTPDNPHPTFLLD